MVGRSLLPSRTGWMSISITPSRPGRRTPNRRTWPWLLSETLSISVVNLMSLPAVDRDDLVAGPHAGPVGGRARHHGADLRGDRVHPLAVGVDEAGQPQEDVHDHAGGDDRHPRPDRLVGVGPGIRRLGLLVLGPLAEHLDEAPQRDRRQDVFRLAPAEAEDRRPEADRELLDLHVVPLGQQEVAQLVDEDHEAQAQRHQHDRHRSNSGLPTLNLPPGPGVDAPQRLERGPRIVRMRIQGRAAGPGDVQEADLPGEEPRDGRLVGGVQGRAGGPAPPHDLEAQLQARERLPVRRLEMQRERASSSPAGGSARAPGPGRSARTGSAAACRAARAARSRCRRRTRRTSARRSPGG